MYNRVNINSFNEYGMNGVNQMKYNIIDFGAEMSDKLQTKQIQAAIDRCYLDGGGEVIIPAGIYRTGSIRLRSNVTLHLLSGAILEGSDNPDDYNSYNDSEIEPIEIYPQGDEMRSVYPFSRWNNGIIRAFYAENIAIIGDENSYIDGVNCYDPEGEEGYRGPHGINMHFCKNIRFEGYTFRNSANWAHAIQKSSNITVKNITVHGGHDGFDVRTCENILIEDCEFYSGDDAIAGYDNYDVLIRNCILNCSCHSLRIGGTDVVVENCEIQGNARYGHRYTMTADEKARRLMTTDKNNHITMAIFNYYCDNRANPRKVPGNMVIRNCKIDGGDCIYMNLFGSIWTKNRELEHLRIENCTFTNMQKGTLFIQQGDEANNGGKMVLELENVTISAKDGIEDTPFMTARYFDKIIFKNVIANGFRNLDVIKELGVSDGEVVIENSSPFVVKNV